MSFATTGFNVLDRLALRIDPDAKVFDLLPVDLSMRTIRERVCCYHALESLGQSYLGDPSAAPLPKDGCSEHPDLRVYEGTPAGNAHSVPPTSRL
ncbi:hypothetical protein BFJ69_g17391 [Fusarium oxysporum]|uniref:Uncharacterized protein n=1 Tax=Fusarium oxysporum TaxID=5507 RepID=A0A420M8F2_FUSOX|nr:hypothetical protein BFJ69_g17391 [Fusarium oxysporum]